MKARVYRCNVGSCGAVWTEGVDGIYTTDRRCFKSPRGEPLRQSMIDQLVALDVVVQGVGS